MTFRPITLLTLAGLVVSGWSALRQARQRRLAQHSQPKPESIQTWEGEGGGLPDGGPGPGVHAAGGTGAAR